MILITGGAGFLGCHLARALAQTNRADLAVCDPALDQRPGILDGCPIRENVSTEELGEFIQDNKKSLEAVFHLGAISSTIEQDLRLLVDSNIRLTGELFDLCGRGGIPFYYASSAAVYGDGSQGFVDDDALASLAGLKPLNPYGWSKAMADLLVATQAAAGNPAPPSWAGLRFFNAYGPGEEHKGEMRSPVAKFHEQILETGRARLFRSSNPDIKDGEQARDFVWVGDCIKVMVWLLDAGPRSGVFNVGTGQARTFSELANAVFSAMEVEPDIEWIPTPKNLEGQYQFHTRAEMGKLRKAGYSGEVTALEKGVGLYVAALEAASA